MYVSLLLSLMVFEEYFKRYVLCYLTMETSWFYLFFRLTLKIWVPFVESFYVFFISS